MHALKPLPGEGFLIGEKLQAALSKLVKNMELFQPVRGNVLPEIGMEPEVAVPYAGQAELLDQSKLDEQAGHRANGTAAGLQGFGKLFGGLVGLVGDEQAADNAPCHAREAGLLKGDTEFLNQALFLNLLPVSHHYIYYTVIVIDIVKTLIIEISVIIENRRWYRYREMTGAGLDWVLWSLFAQFFRSFVGGFDSFHDEPVEVACLKALDSGGSSATRRGYHAAELGGELTGLLDKSSGAQHCL